MTADTELTSVGAIQILLVAGRVDAVTRTAVHRHTAARISSLFTHRVGDGVLVSVAVATDVDQIAIEKEGSVGSMRSMAGRALDLVGMGGESKGRARARSAGIMAVRADTDLLLA